MATKVTDAAGVEYKTYKNNPNLKGMYNTVGFTKEQIAEYIKCSEDPIYFIEKYVKIINLDHGLMDFKMFDFQKTMVETYNKNRFAITLCPRQVGKSVTAIAGFMLWYVLFQADKNCCILANKGSLAREQLGRLRTAYENLPLWIQQGVRTWNKGKIELENGSCVVAASTSSSSVRGNSYNLIFLDEFAHVSNNLAEEFFESVYPTIASGKNTKVIIVSTPNGMNLFYKLWTDATEGRNSYVPIRVHWQDVPGRDEEWKEETIANTSEKQFEQEHECLFLGSANTLISGHVLARLAFHNPLSTSNNIKFFEKPEPEKKYTIVVDVARGVGLDYSAFSVFDVTGFPYKQVAAYKDNKIAPIMYPQIIYKVAKMFNEADVLVEVNDIGGQVAEILYHDLEYENVFFTTTSTKKGQIIGGGFSGNSKLGVKTSPQVKNIGCSTLKTLVESDGLILNDFDTVSELTTFISKGSSYAAEEGKNDDMAMTLVLFAWLTTQQFFKDYMEHDFREKLFEDQMRMLEEELTPVGIFSDGISDSSFVDSDGTRWTSAKW